MFEETHVRASNAILSPIQTASAQFPNSTAIGGDLGYARFAEMIQLGFLSHKRAPRIEHQVVDGVSDKRVAIAIHYSNLSGCGWLSRPKTSSVANVKTGKCRLRVLFEFIRCRSRSRPCWSMSSRIAGGDSELFVVSPISRRDVALCTGRDFGNFRRCKSYINNFEHSR
jgi:hypothetical protein